MDETIKQFLVGFISRWILKIAAGFFLALGYTEASATDFIIAAVTFIIGVIISLIQHKQAINTPAPK